MKEIVYGNNDAREKVKVGDDSIESILDGIYDVLDEISSDLKKN